MLLHALDAAEMAINFTRLHVLVRIDDMYNATCLI